MKMFSNYTAWQIDEKEFPADKSIEEKIRFLVGFGLLAPSSHNTQPWKVVIENNTLSVYGDYSRKLEYSDPTGRMFYTALGAFIENIKIAANHFSVGFSVEYNTELKNGRPEKIAEIKFGENTQETSKNPNLLGAVVSRASYRAPYPNKSISKEIIDGLRQLSNEVSNLDVFTDLSDREELAPIVAIGMKDKMAQGHFRRELAHWLRHNLTWRKDGMQGSGHEMNFIVSVLSPFILRTIDVSSVEKKKALRRVTNFPGVAIITTQKDSAFEWIKTGELLQRALIILESKGLRASIMVAGIESEEAREEMQKFLNKNGVEGIPQMFFGFGYPQKNVPHSPRLGIKNVIIK